MNAAWRQRRSHFVDAPSGRLHVERLGDPQAPALVRLHDGGGGFGARPWAPALLEALDECGPLQLLRVDRRGYGLSEPRPEGFSPDFFLRDLADLEAVIDGLLPAEPLRLAGTSDGGTIAILYAARRPRRVQALAVDGAHHRIHPDLPAGLAAMRRLFVARHGERPLADESMERRTARNWFDGWARLVESDWNVLAELAALRRPLWVLQGERDGIVPDAYAEDLAASAGGPARCEILPEGGHLCERSHPRLWGDWLKRFLRATA